MFDEIGDGLVGFETHENVNVVGFVFDCDKLVLLVFDDSCYVLLQFIFVFARYQALAAFHSKDEVDVELCVGVRHNISLLRSFEKIFALSPPVETGGYKYFAPMERVHKIPSNLRINHVFCNSKLF